MTAQPGDTLDRGRAAGAGWGRNIFNSDLVSLARYNADFSGARRIYLREPRSWRLTLSLEY